MIKASSPPRKLVERKVPSGLNSAWKLWRHCMCRNGFYPLIIAPFVTSAFFLDIYVSSGCDFVHVNIGIEPVNVAWNKSTLDLGLFSHRSDEESNSNRNLMMETFHPQCKGYGPTFDEYFVDGDKTWKMAQIIALVACCAGGVATMVIWMMIITPLPSCFFWPGVLLPAVLVELLAGSARFLLFDSQICLQDLWVPEGEDSVGQAAESCTLSRDSWIAIVTSVLSLMNVLLICLRAPKRRNLDDNYGMQYEDVNNDMANLRTDTMEDSTCQSFDNDVEGQRERKRTWRPQNLDLQPSYDLEEIVQQQMLGSDAEKQRHRQSTRASTRHSKTNAVTTNRDVVKVEQPRAAQPRLKHSNKEVKSAIGKKHNAGFGEKLPRHSVAELKTPKELHLDKHQPIKPKTAPSDEGGSVFRSPLKAFKGTFSPRVLKSSKWKKQDNSNFSSPKPYDENIIFNCIDNLEKQFAAPDADVPNHSEP